MPLGELSGLNKVCLHRNIQVLNVSDIHLSSRHSVSRSHRDEAMAACSRKDARFTSATPSKGLR